MTAFWKKEAFLWGVYSLLAVVTAMLKLRQPSGGIGHTAYENYLIFRNAPGNLLDFANPYAYYFNQTWDQYKYSPAFALAMWPFSQISISVGLPLWNLLNAAVLLAAILHLPVPERRQRCFMAWFVLLELVTSMQNAQSNGLAAGLFLWAFIAFERGRLAQAGAWTAANAFLKILGGLSGLMAWMYPRPLRFVAWAVLWGLLLAAVPFLFLPYEHTLRVYGWWVEMLRFDHSVSVGYSVQGWLQTWFGLRPPKMAVLGFGLLILVLSIVRIRPAAKSLEWSISTVPNTLTTRSWAWAGLLLWSVIFNHKAESPTFIIAMCGVALWYLNSPQRRPEKIFLGITFVLVSLSPTDLFPPYIRTHFLQPYVLKAVPCIALWGWVSWSLLRGRPLVTPA